MDNEFLDIIDRNVAHITGGAPSGGGQPMGATPSPSDTAPRLDPRPDLASDSETWEYVLYFIEYFSGNIFGRIHFLRCGGARIEPTGMDNVVKRSYKLLPGAEEWVTPKAWAAQKKKVLDPVRDVLIWLFHNAASAKMAGMAPEEVEAMYNDCPFLKSKGPIPEQAEQEVIPGWMGYAQKPNRRPS